VSLGVDPRAKACNGSVPLHSACARASAQADLVQYLLGLPGAAAALKAVDASGRTPLHVAADKGSEAAVQAQLQRGADVTAADYNGATPLMFVKTPSVLKLLLAAGADAAAADTVGCTALHYCARSNAAAGAVCLLLKAGTDPTATALNRSTAADLAGDKGYCVLQSLLLRAADDYRKAHPTRASAVKHSAVGGCSTGTAAAASSSTAAVTPAIAAAAAAALTTDEPSSSSSALRPVDSSSSSSDSSTNTAVAAAQPSAVSTGCASSSSDTISVLQQQQPQQKPAGKKAKHPCANCGRTEHTRRCRACAAVYYCSIQCQKVCFADAQHRADCEAKAAAAVAIGDIETISIDNK
jgi:Ankyrin repeats (3 copies)